MIIVVSVFLSFKSTACCDLLYPIQKQKSHLLNLKEIQHSQSYNGQNLAMDLIQSIRKKEKSGMTPRFLGSNWMDGGVIH